jgi:predicted exporter
LLPSVAVQLQRQAALPDPATLAANVTAAAADLGFAPTAFTPFERDVAAARLARPLEVVDLPKPLALRLSAMLYPREKIWLGLIAPSGTKDAARLAGFLSAQSGVTYIDMAAESNALVNDSLDRTWRPLIGGGLALAASLVVALRDPWRVARVIGAVAAALALTLAGLSAAGQKLTVMHLISLQFVAGVGLDYALFFARPRLDEDERARTLRTLITCASMALLTFGLLAFCRTPLLHAIGLTVSLGVGASLFFSFLLAGEKSGPAVSGTRA